MPRKLRIMIGGGINHANRSRYPEGMRVCILLALGCCTLRADDRTQQLVARLSREADAFRKIAPDLVGQETLFQRALKPPKGGFRIRVGASARNPPQPIWQERTLLSEYS